VKAEARVPLTDPVLSDLGIEHGFGQRDVLAPQETFFAKQVHGVRVVRVGKYAPGGEADAVLSTEPGTSVGIVTADCVPLLAATIDGSAVVAIHAGWRGLAAGVIEAGLEALEAANPGVSIAVAVGPSARGCCYEVDAPVRDGLAARYEKLLGSVCEVGRSGRFQLDLPKLGAEVVRNFGVKKTQIGIAQCHCTICDARRFESFRREGESAGRLKHFLTVSAPKPRQG